MKRGVRSLKIVTLIVLFLGLVLSMQAPAQESPKSCQVASNQNIQDAIDAGTIFERDSPFKGRICELIVINPGVYNKRLVITKQHLEKKGFLHLKPFKEFGTVIIQPLKEDRSKEDEAISIEGTDKEVKIERLVITGTSVTGISVLGAKERVLINGNFIGTASFGVPAGINKYYSDGDGINVQNTKDIEITHTRIMGNKGCGISIDAETKENIKDKIISVDFANTVRGNGKGNRCGLDPPNPDQAKIIISQNVILPTNFIDTDFLTIQEAIDAAVEGDTIMLMAPRGDKNYQENLTITKSLTLQGEDRNFTILQAQQNGQPVIKISKDGITATVKSVTIDGAQKPSSVGIQIDNGVVNIEDVNVRNNNKGIEILSGNIKVNLIGGTLITENISSGIFIASQPPSPNAPPPQFNLVITGDDLSTITNNPATGIAIDIKDNASGQINIRNLQLIRNKGHGISLSSPDNVEVIVEKNALIFGNGDDFDTSKFSGISVGGSSKIVVKNSTIGGNFGGGITLGDKAQATIESSTISGNRRNGIHIVGSAKVTIKNLKDLSFNDENGILLEARKENTEKLEATIENNRIDGNKFWGIAAFIDDCFLLLAGPLPPLSWKEFAEKAKVKPEANGNNVISQNGNALPVEQIILGDGVGDVCPAELDFLKKK